MTVYGAERVIQRRPRIVAASPGNDRSTIGDRAVPPRATRTSWRYVPARRHPVWPGRSESRSLWTVANGCFSEPRERSEPCGEATRSQAVVVSGEPLAHAASRRAAVNSTAAQSPRIASEQCKVCRSAGEPMVARASCESGITRMTGLRRAARRPGTLAALTARRSEGPAGGGALCCVCVDATRVCGGARPSYVCSTP